MKAPHKLKKSIFRHICEQPYNERTRLKLYNSAKGNLDFIQRLALQRSLPVHNGCVNCICWNDTGEFLLSGSDDQHLVISHAYNYKMLTDYKTSHRANIFSAKFLPCSGDKNIVSCSGDGMILFTDLFRATETRNNQFNCHKGTTYEIATVPNEPHTFLSCGEDYTVRYYDLRVKEKCYKENCDEDVLISCQRAVTALAINNIRPYQMAIGCSDSTVRIFDRRMIGTKSSGFKSIGGRSPRPFASFTAPGMEDRSYRITSLGFSPQGEDVLVSYSSEHLYLFSIKDESAIEYSVEASGDEEEEESSKPMGGLPPVRRLRLRGDWSDTGPDARPERDTGRFTDAAQARPTLHATLMQRMTDVLSRMLNDPATRAALSHGGDEDHNEYVEDNNRSDRAEDASGVRSPSFLGGDPPVVAVSIEGIYSESSSQPDAEMADVATESSQVRWSPPLASPTPTPAEDAVSLPSFESSFTPPTPPTASASASGSGSASASADSQPSTSTGVSGGDGDGSGDASGSGGRDSNLSTITDQLSTMRHGFIERHGTEPVVNLTYSDKGMDASRISLSVADEVNRETVPQQQLQQELPGPSSEESPAASSTSPPVPQTGLSLVNDDGDFIMDSDENLDEPPISSSQKRSSCCRKPHPIEEEMEEAIRNATGGPSQTTIDDRVKVRKPSVKQKYTGHRNARTMIKEATFWGDEFVMSGSDCGHVFVWERDSARLVMLLEADHHVVNCIQPHPYLPILATSGIDYDVKLWAPIQPEPNFNLEMAEELVKRNEVMLEETKDTITVPASFMIRMLACLNQIRRGARSRNRRHDNSGSSDQHQD